MSWEIREVPGGFLLWNESERRYLMSQYCEGTPFHAIHIFTTRQAAEVALGILQAEAA